MIIFSCAKFHCDAGGGGGGAVPLGLTLNKNPSMSYLNNCFVQHRMLGENKHIHSIII